MSYKYILISMRLRHLFRWLMRHLEIMVHCYCFMDHFIFVINMCIGNSSAYSLDTTELEGQSCCLWIMLLFLSYIIIWIIVGISSSPRVG